MNSSRVNVRWGGLQFFKIKYGYLIHDFLQNIMASIIVNANDYFVFVRNDSRIFWFYNAKALVHLLDDQYLCSGLVD